jgi:hypothetical protein
VPAVADDRIAALVAGAVEPEAGGERDADEGDGQGRADPGPHPRTTPPPGPHAAPIAAHQTRACTGIDEKTSSDMTAVAPSSAGIAALPRRAATKSPPTTSASSASSPGAPVSTAASAQTLCGLALQSIGSFW